ncbi:DUF4256 domain-containing protein [Flavobacterium ponti]|uniref:DUF4256 domain-containing protein n=1 Tax=Flavobacterium ponti TaxID=665133 RepID=A0ABV9P5T8_9FLAO
MEHQLQLLKTRFYENPNRHKDLDWHKIEEKLIANPKKIAILEQMEKTGGEPDVVGFDEEKNQYLFVDCSSESPAGRRSFCYDKEALESRKQNKPKDSAVEAAKAIGIELLNEDEYRNLQQLGNFDTKTSSWLKTPEKIRKLGGAIFGDFRFDTVFIYHNGAESYYAARGLRGILKV